MSFAGDGFLVVFIGFGAFLWNLCPGTEGGERGEAHYYIKPFHDYYFWVANKFI